MAAKALVQFLLFSQAIAGGVSSASGSKGSVSVSPSGKGSQKPSPSVQPSVKPSSPTKGSASPTTTKKTASSPVSSPGSVKPTTSLSQASTPPSSIQPSKPTTAKSSTPSKQPSSIPSSNSLTPSKSPSVKPSSFASSSKSTASQTPSVQPSVKPSGSVTPSKFSSKPVSTPSKASSPSSQASKPPTSSSQPSKPSSVISSIKSSKPASSPSKPASGTVSKPVSSIPSKPVSGSKPPSSIPPSKASSIPSKASGIPSKASSIPSKASGIKSSASPSKPVSSIPSVAPSKPVSGTPSKSASGSASKRPSSIASKSPSSIKSGFSSIPSKTNSFRPTGSISKPVVSGSISPSGSKPVSSIPSGSKPISSPSKGPSSGSISKPVVSSSLSPSGSKPVSSIPSGSKPISSPSKGPSSGSAPNSKPTTKASGSISKSIVPSGSVKPSPSSGSLTSGRPSGSPSVSKSGNSGNGSQPPNTKTPGSSASGTNKGSTTTKQNGSSQGPGTVKPTGSQPPNSNGGNPGASGTTKPTGSQPPNSNGGQPGASGTNGQSAPGSMKPTGKSTAGPIGGSSSQKPTGGNGGGGNGGGECPATCQSACPTAATGATATLGCGKITGTTTSLYAATATVNKFLGVPFAQKPRRFSPPQKGASCDVEAKAFKPACIQQFVYPKIVQDFTKAIFNNPGGAPPEESEDCLYLNVYAPSSPAPADGRAVMFWLYGGSLEFGTAGIPFYDGSYFAAYEDVIVVTTNYRTNVFGFATSPEIPVSERNLGFLDQRAALDWVQKNIAAFGGSPDKVTIFGESAGAFSVDALLTSFSANSTPPFRGAIMQSGQFGYNAQSRPSTVPQWNQLASILNCPANYTSNLACMRAADASAIKGAIEMNILTFNPVADGVTLVSNPMQQRLSGNIAPVPVLAGTNSQEGRVFALGQTNTTAYLSGLGFGNNTAAINALEAAYPINSTGISSQYEQSAQIFTELVFHCPAAFQTRDYATIGVPAWRYYYNASFYNSEAYPGLGVYHASEIPTVFSTYPRQNVTVQQYALSRTMRNIWASFAKNPAAGPGWNPVGSGMEARVLVGASGLGEGAILMGLDGSLQKGTYDLGVLGNHGDTLGSGVTIIDSSEVDARCDLYTSIYQANARIG